MSVSIVCQKSEAPLQENKSLQELVITPSPEVARVRMCKNELGDANQPKKNQVRLRVPATIQVAEDRPLDVVIFIDTGSEISLVRRGLISESYMQTAQRPMQLLAANGQPMKGGLRELRVDLRVLGKDTKTKKKFR